MELGKEYHILERLVEVLKIVQVLDLNHRQVHLEILHLGM